MLFYEWTYTWNASYVIGKTDKPIFKGFFTLPKFVCAASLPSSISLGGGGEVRPVILKSG